MPTIRSCPLPDGALLRRYAEPTDPDLAGSYTDCYTTRVDGHVALAEFVAAFYTTRLFRLERWILAAFASLPSSDAQARALASGDSDAFAAWTVEARAPRQLLLCDVAGRTRSWLMCAPAGTAGRDTELYFGSAVVPAAGTQAGPGAPMGLLLPAHRVYSRLLLGAARSRLANTR